MINGIFGGVGSNHSHQPLVRTDTIVVIALSALSFLIAPSFNNSAPALSALLRVLPIGLSLYWLFSRIFPGSGWNHYQQQQAPVVVQGTPVVVQQTPAPSFWSRHYWTSSWNTPSRPSWWTRMWMAPVARSTHPAVHHTTVVHNPPVNATFPAVQRTSAQSGPTVIPAPVNPTFPAVQRTSAQPGPTVIRASVNPTFPSVQRTSAQPGPTVIPASVNQTFTAVRQAPAQQSHPAQAARSYTPAPSAPSLAASGTPTAGGRVMFSAATTRN